jgi:hypothetical protein
VSAAAAMSELDKVCAEIAAKRAQQEDERRQHQRRAAEFLKAFFEADLKPSKILKTHGVEGAFTDNKVILHKTASGHYADPLYIVVGEQGEIDINGRSLGRYEPKEKAARKRELIDEIISFFDL